MMTQTLLSHNRRFTFSVFLVVFLLSSNAFAIQERTVYGEDGREDYYQSSVTTQDLMKSVAALMDFSVISSDGAGGYNLPSSSGNTLQDLIMQSTGVSICPNTSFADQPTFSNCSAFLIGYDLLLTVGSCFGDININSSCSNIVVVFDYVMTASNLYKSNFNSSQVYTCSEVISSSLDTPPYFAIFRTTEPVQYRNPFTLFRDYNSVQVGQNVSIIGTPSGLPLKSDTGSIISITNQTGIFQFVTDLDAFSAQGGSPVFDADGAILGFFVSSGEDFTVTSNNCSTFYDCQSVNGSSSACPGSLVESICSASSYSSLIPNCGTNIASPSPIIFPSYTRAPASYYPSAAPSLSLPFFSFFFSCFMLGIFLL